MKRQHAFIPGTPTPGFYYEDQMQYKEYMSAYDTAISEMMRHGGGVALTFIQSADGEVSQQLYVPLASGEYMDEDNQHLRQEVMQRMTAGLLSQITTELVQIMAYMAEGEGEREDSQEQVARELMEQVARELMGILMPFLEKRLPSIRAQIIVAESREEANEMRNKELADRVLN